MQVAKYWRNRKLRYRLVGMPRLCERAFVHPCPEAKVERNGRQAPKRQPARLPQ